MDLGGSIKKQPRFLLERDRRSPPLDGGACPSEPHHAMRWEIWVGATEQELVESIGQPAEIEDKILKTKKRQIFKYVSTGKGRFALRVTVENGVVAGWEGRPDAPREASEEAERAALRVREMKDAMAAWEAQQAADNARREAEEANAKIAREQEERAQAEALALATASAQLSARRMRVVWALVVAVVGGLIWLKCASG